MLAVTARASLSIAFLATVTGSGVTPAASPAATNAPATAAAPASPIRYPTLPPEWTATWTPMPTDVASRTPTPRATASATPSATLARAAAPYTGHFLCFGDEHGVGASQGDITIEPAGGVSMDKRQVATWTYDPASNKLIFANSTLLASATYYSQTDTLGVTFVAGVTLPHADLGHMGCVRAR